MVQYLTVKENRFINQKDERLFAMLSVIALIDKNPFIRTMKNKIYT